MHQVFFKIQTPTQLSAEGRDIVYDANAIPSIKCYCRCKELNLEVDDDGRAVSSVLNVL